MRAFLRLYAEFDNYKKRTAREKTDWIKYASSDVLSALLPVLDDFERGLAAAEKERPESAESEGFRLIYNKMMDVLRQKGLTVVEVHPGDELNVDYHDAIARIPAPQESLKGKIVDITQKGYKIGDRVIRYAKVVVGECGYITDEKRRRLQKIYEKRLLRSIGRIERCQRG